MKVLLVSANTVRTPYYVYPLGLDYVASSISSGHLVKIADINAGEKTQSILELIRDFKPEVIGISIRNIDNADAAESRNFIKRYRDFIFTVRKNSSAVIVLGGSGFTIFPERLMRVLEPDYGIIGEGERMAAFLEALESGRDPSSLPGVIAPGAREAFPPPFDTAFPRTVMDGTVARFYIARGGMLNLQSKRGCTYRCIYCTYPHIEGTALRLIPADDVADTARRLEQAGARYLYITDSVFNTSYDHSLDVARAFMRKGVSVPWGAFFAPTRPPEGYYRELHRAGLIHVEFGTEALADQMLASYRKPFQIDDVFYAHKAAIDSGLHVAHYILLGGPGENPDTVRETLENAERLANTVIFFFCGIRIFPHTEIYEIALREGQISESDDLLEPVFYQSESISAEEIIRTVEKRAGGRENWFIGSGGNKSARLVSRLHKRGHIGPLWEHMIR
jgi:radical SAM superfamily enzyme YgiQ (UPF0313 family)